MKPTRLYIKQHAITGLKYFGKTVKDNVSSYHGSGKYWKSHIKAHGVSHVNTLWVSDYFTEKEDLVEFASFFSEIFDIAKSSEWANLKEENGLDGHPTGVEFSDETRRKISNALTGKTRPESVRLKIAEANRNRSEESLQKMRKSLTGKKRKPFSEETRKKMSDAKRKHYNDLRKGK